MSKHNNKKSVKSVNKKSVKGNPGFAVTEVVENRNRYRRVTFTTPRMNIEINRPVHKSSKQATYAVLTDPNTRAEAIIVGRDLEKFVKAVALSTSKR